MMTHNPFKDTYPYEATWKSLSPQQQRYVRGRANRAKVSIPAILGEDIKAQKDYCAEQAALAAARKQKSQWTRLIAKMRKVDGWTVTQADGKVSVPIGGIDVTAEFDVYEHALAFYEGYTSK